MSGRADCKALLDPCPLPLPLLLLQHPSPAVRGLAAQSPPLPVGVCRWGSCFAAFVRHGDAARGQLVPGYQQGRALAPGAESKKGQGKEEFNRQRCQNEPSGNFIFIA